MKELLLVLVIVFSFFQSYCQHSPRPLGDSKLSIGFNTGYIESTLYGSYIDNELNNNYPGPRAVLVKHKAIEMGFFINRQLYKFLYLKAGLGYAQLGGKLDHTSFTYPVDVTLNYLTVPLGLGVNPIALHKISFAADAGFLMNVEISSKQEFKKGVLLGEQKGNTIIPGYFWSGSILYAITSKISIQVSYRSMDSLKPFYEFDYVNSKEIKTKAKSISIGLNYVLK